MIEVKNLSYRYGSQRVLKNLSFTVNQGEFMGIVGPNGSGKSTLLRILSGIIRPEQGEVRVKGREAFSFSRKEMARFMAVLPQAEHFSFSFTVRDVVAMGRHPHQRGFWPIMNAQDRQLIDEVMEYLDLKDMENHSIMRLSGGQKQRVLLARMLVQAPEIVLLDEPTNHLDIYYQIEILNYLNKWREDRRITVISVLHDLNLTALYADRILVLNQDGEIAACGKVEQALSSQIIAEVFGTETVQIRHPLLPKPQFVLLPQK